MKKNRYKEEYEELMRSFTPGMPLEEVTERWYKCFRYFLKSLKVGFTDKTVDHLFYKWDMRLVGSTTRYNSYGDLWLELFVELCQKPVTNVDDLFQIHHTYLQFIKFHEK